FYTSARNPVKEILLKMNLPDHRVLKDGGEVKEFQRSFSHSDTERLSRSDEVLKLKNFKKDATLKLFKSTNQESWWHLSPPASFPPFFIKDIASGSVVSQGCPWLNKVIHGVFQSGLWVIWNWRNKVVKAPKKKTSPLPFRGSRRHGSRPVTLSNRSRGAAGLPAHLGCSHKKREEPAIGIDLGTTYSCVAVWQNNRVEIITIEQGNITTPSCVAFTEMEPLIGDAAKNQIDMNPANTLFGATKAETLPTKNKGPTSDPKSLLGFYDFDFIPSHNDLGSDLDVSSPSGDRNKIYDPGICIEVESKRFLATLSPVIDTLLPFSSKNKDKVFNHGVLASKEKSPPSSSHRGFKASKLFHHKSPMLIHGENNPNLGPGHLSRSRLECAKKKVATWNDLAFKIIVLGWNVKRLIHEDLDLLHEDLEQIDDMDIEEMDINWQIAMIAIRMKKFYKKTGRRVQIDGNKPVGFDKKKLECFKCHNTGHFARECPSKGTNDGKKRDSFYQDQGARKKEQNQNLIC
ncbi:ribonuclease H-like domain-containing protein, partial [Tanacetum coccineum]